MTRPLHVLLAQCKLQTSPIAQPRVRYIHTAVPDPSCSITPPCQKIVPSLTGDINPQSSHYNNGKWKLPVILPTSSRSRQQLQISMANHYSLFLSLFQHPRNHYMPSAKYLCTSWLFLPVISECTLIASKKSIRLFTCTELLLLGLLVIRIGPNLPYLNAIIDERTTRKQRHVKCSHRLAIIAQTAQNKHATGNTIDDVSLA